MRHVGWLALTIAGAANAQTVLDRVDPTRVEREKDRPPVADRPSPPVVDEPTNRPVATGPQVTVGAIELTGLMALRRSDFADLFTPYLGRPLDSAELSTLVEAIVSRARNRGYVFATASVPAQAVSSGVLRVAVDEGRIDDVRVTGADNPAIRGALLPLATGAPVTLAELERRLLIAGDIDGALIRRSRIVQEGGRQILVVDAKQDRLSAVAALSNEGTRPLGPVQAELRLRASRLLTDRDTLTLIGSITPTEPSELQYGALRYAQRVGNSGGELFGATTLSHTRPGAYLESLDLEGFAWSGTVGGSHPLFRRRAASLWIEGLFTIRRAEQDRADKLVRRDRLSVVRVGVFGSALAGGGRLRVNATVSRGLGVFDATDAGDRLASRRDADGRFTSLGLTANWTVSVTARLEAQLGVATQIASGPLLASEEVGLGGNSYLRAYDYSERSGDQGAMASIEVRRRFDVAANRVVARPEVYGFVDGGRVTNFRGGFGSGSLASTGGGVRALVFGTGWADIAVAAPLSGRRYDSGDKNAVFLFRLSTSL